MLPPKPSDTALSPAQTLIDGAVPQRYSTVRRYVLLIVFCFAQFLDAFNNSALFSAIPALIVSLGISESESTWMFSAFQLTFASFLLISGRLSDVYNPKVAFIAGITGLGVISIGAGFVQNKVVLIILRAVCGIFAAMTIPSALSLLVNVFVEPREQARAIGIFGGCGAMGNVLGLIIGALFVEFASWRWVFWFVAIVAIPIGAACVVLVPPQEAPVADVSESRIAKWKTLDLIGITILTAALILFIFAITSGSTDGWASAAVLAPLIVSVFMVAGFFYYETIIPPSTAAIPPSTWFLPNFAVLFGTALLPFLWWTTMFSTYTNLWQGIYMWTAVNSAVHMIPNGVLSLAMSFTGGLAEKVSPKYIILFGETLLAVATALLALADSPEKYWPYVFPGFVLGSTGAMLTYTHTNIAIFRTSPSSMAGTVGAIFNGALQLGSAVGIAAVGSITTSVQEKSGVDNYAGQAASFWFIFALVIAELIAMLVFYRVQAEAEPLPDSGILGMPELTQKVDVPNYVDDKLDEKSPEELAVSPV